MWRDANIPSVAKPPRVVQERNTLTGKESRLNHHLRCSLLRFPDKAEELTDGLRSLTLKNLQKVIEELNLEE